MLQIGIYGIGGFAREVYPLVKSNDKKILFVTEKKDENYKLWKNKKEIIFFNDFKNLKKKKIVIAIADPIIRKKIYLEMKQNEIDFFQVYAKNSVILDDVKVGECSILCPFTTLTSNISIGKGFHLNIYSYVGHDCKIGNFVTFAPSVKCNGNVIIEDNVYVGTGVIIKQGTLKKPRLIGKNSKISAGTYINKNVPPNHIAFGNPCRFIKQK